MSEDGEYPIDCEACGDMITSEDDDFNGQCEDCYNTPPDEE